jgi:hypothetical protein
MSESFFDRLELELRAAAERPPRRLAGWGAAGRAGAIALAVAVALALALVPAVVLLGGNDSGRTPATQQPHGHEPAPVGTVIHRGQGNPPGDGNHTVVATGTAPYGGPWQMEVYRSSPLKDPRTGEVYQPDGLPCLELVLLDPPRTAGVASGGSCGVMRRTPGFSRSQLALPPKQRGVKEVLVFGRVPARARAVVLTADGGIRTEVKPYPGPKRVRGDFYLMVVKPKMEHARVNWLDAEGRRGSRGIALQPPASGHVLR